MTEAKRPNRPCDICHQNPAEMVVNDVSKDGHTTELSICAQCAKEKGLAAPGKEKPSVAEILQELKAAVQDADTRLACPNCRLTYAEFKKTLRLGCGECYAAFAERLNPTIRRIHGSLRHAGRVPQTNGNAVRDFEIQRLRRDLRKAIEQEDYERAAAVRDRIHRAGGAIEPGNGEPVKP